MNYGKWAITTLAGDSANPLVYPNLSLYVSMEGDISASDFLLDDSQFHLVFVTMLEIITDNG